MQGFMGSIWQKLCNSEFKTKPLQFGKERAAFVPPHIIADARARTDRLDGIGGCVPFTETSHCSVVTVATSSQGLEQIWEMQKEIPFLILSNGSWDENTNCSLELCHFLSPLLKCNRKKFNKWKQFETAALIRLGIATEYDFDSVILCMAYLVERLNQHTNSSPNKLIL